MIKLEGYLKKWTNYISRWQNRYFILEDGILQFGTTKGEKEKGIIYLKIATVKTTPDDPLKIIINSGTKEIILRASSIIDKFRWVNALRYYHGNISKDQENISIDTNKSIKHDISRKSTFTTQLTVEEHITNFNRPSEHIEKILEAKNKVEEIIKMFDKESLSPNIKTFILSIEDATKELIVIHFLN